MDELIKQIKEQDAAIVESWIVSVETREAKATLQRIANEIRNSTFPPSTTDSDG